MEELKTVRAELSMQLHYMRQIMELERLQQLDKVQRQLKEVRRQSDKEHKRFREEQEQTMTIKLEVSCYVYIQKFSFGIMNYDGLKML